MIFFDLNMKNFKQFATFAILTSISFLLTLGMAAGQGLPEDAVPQVPEDLVDDEHVREEFGVNSITTPSIKRLFDDLDTFGKLPYDRLKREIPERPPRSRPLVALGLGALVADGFLIVQAEDISQIESVGKAILNYARILGSGMKLSRHSNAILEKSGLGKWDELKKELSAAQNDVEAEMVMLRDVDIVHLVSLGGWVRALEIASKAAIDPYEEKKANIVQRADIVEYFYQILQGLEPDIRKLESVQKVTEAVREIHEIILPLDGETIPEKTLVTLARKATLLRVMIEGK